MSNASTNPSPPAISLTPSSQAPRNRSRAGTLPASFLAQPLTLASSTSPLISTNSSDFNDPFSIGPSHISPAPNHQPLDFPDLRRMRSGSLFSSNSIWNDDSVSAHSNHFLDPTYSGPNGTRNRSYTTNAAMAANPNIDMSSRLSTSPFMTKNNDINPLLDNLMVNMSTSPNSRHRAQTYSGILPEDFQTQSLLAAAQHQQLPQQALSQHQQPFPQPVLQDDFDFSQLVITNNFENPGLGPTPLLLFDNLPLFVAPVKLWSILCNSLASRAVGSILSIKSTSTTTSRLALVECSSVEVAMRLKASFNHLEIVTGVILYVAFAKCTEIGLHPSEQHPPAKEAAPVVSGNGVAPANLADIQDSLLYSVTKLVNDNPSIDVNKIVSLIKKSVAYPNENYQDNFGPLPAPILIRQFDAPKLRELRKILEFNEQLQGHGRKDHHQGTGGSDSDDNELHKVLSQTALEELCLAMLDELPELCYDYLGNTIVQKIFTLVKSPLIKYLMVKEIAPYLTQLSIHKNGTWAIQKIINICHNDYQEENLIGKSLKPYAIKLFNDQFGNYVIQACIKFGSPFNDFIFEAMLDKFIEISFGRFGARCIRTILETNSPQIVTNEQVVLVSSLIIEYANELVVNNNGSLLITWFLDTFSGCGAKFDNRFSLLAHKFLPNLSTLCVHKLANLTILKILNNRTDFKAKQLIMDAIFGEFDDAEDEVKPASATLEAILSESPENTTGPLFIYKILSNPLLLNLNNSEERDNKGSRYQKFVVQQIRRLLLEINITNYQPYKKLMDEVGLSSTRLNHGSTLGRRGKRSNSNARNGNHATAGANYAQSAGYGAYPTSNPPPQVASGGAAVLPAPVPQQSQPPQAYQQMMMNQPMMMGMAANAPNMYVQGNMYASNQMRTAPPPMPSSQQDLVMQQLEQLSLSSAALGYHSNPDTPDGHEKQFF